MDDELRHREIDIPGGVTLFLGNHQPSFTAVLRAVKRAEHGIFNCIASIVQDYEFISDVATAFTPYPLLPNLRCGLWYAATATDTCYFKSTDGHSGQWSFSTARLNLHVAHIAAQHGGICIVDATRRGKTFPDALTKTIPIWATVINRALAKLKTNNTTSATTASAPFHCFSDDLDLHLPHWISKNEKNQIEQRIDTWVDELLALGVDLTLLESSLKKPLRCLWVSQEENIDSSEEDWLEIAENEDYKSKYTLLVLISASIPNKRERRRLIVDSSTAGLSSSFSDVSHNSSSSSGSSSKNDDSTISNNPELLFKEPLDVMYDYIPGAGDDEESWAKGLTPRLMWENVEDLLQSGPEDIGNVVKKLVKSQLMSDRAQKRTGAGARAVGGGGGGGVSLFGDNWKVEWIAECVGIGLSTQRPEEILKEGEDGEPEGSIAVLDVGCTASPFSPSFSRIALNKDDNGTSTQYLHLPIAGDKNIKRAVLHAVPAAVQFASTHLSSTSATNQTRNFTKNKLLVVAEPEAIDIAASIVVAILIACFKIGEDGSIVWARPAQFYPGSTTQLIPTNNNNNCTPDSTGNHGTGKNSDDSFTRTTVRQYLSFVSVHYPQVVLSKSLLKQIYNAFLPESMVRPNSGKEKETS